VSAWLKEKAEALPPLEATLKPLGPEQKPVLEMDELCSYVFEKKQNLGLDRTEQSDPRSHCLCVW